MAGFIKPAARGARQESFAQRLARLSRTSIDEDVLDSLMGGDAVDLSGEHRRDGFDGMGEGTSFSNLHDFADVAGFDDVFDYVGPGVNSPTKASANPSGPQPYDFKNMAEETEAIMGRMTSFATGEKDFKRSSGQNPPAVEERRRVKTATSRVSNEPTAQLKNNTSATSGPASFGGSEDKLSLPGDQASQLFSTELPSSKKSRRNDHGFTVKAHGHSGMTYKPKVAKSMNFLCFRKGLWGKAESAYLIQLFTAFDEGTLDIPINYPLRIFLSQCLACDPMRISKKFVGDKQVGKQRFIPISYAVMDTIDKTEHAAKKSVFEETQSAFQQYMVGCLKVDRGFQDLSIDDLQSRMLWPKYVDISATSVNSGKSALPSLSGIFNPNESDEVLSFNLGTVDRDHSFGLDFSFNNAELDDISFDSFVTTEHSDERHAELIKNALAMERLVIGESRDPRKYEIGKPFENNLIAGTVVHIDFQSKEVFVHVDKTKAATGLTSKRMRD